MWKEARGSVAVNVFEAFPNAIISGIWEIGEVERASVVGDAYTTLNSLDVIVEEAADGNFHKTPDADDITNDTLVYAKPEQLPSLAPAKLTGDYLLKNAETGQFYDIIGADIGKNQETGEIEHVELWVRPTEAIENE